MDTATHSGIEVRVGMTDLVDEPALFSVDRPVTLACGLTIGPRIYSGVRRAGTTDPMRRIETFLITDGVHGILDDVDVTAEVLADEIQIV